MKTITTSLLLFLLSVTFCKAQTTPAILREWAVTAGNTDSSFRSPVLTDGSYTYVATVVVNTSTGPDIRIVKYNEGGDRVWSTDWSGSGSARDQAASMVMDSLYLYICGATYTSSTNDYDYVTMCMDKSGGNISWVKTFNGSASSYDVATAIVQEDSVVFVTGVANNTGTSLDYHTICYKKENGNLLWEQEFDYNSFMDIPFALTLKSSDEIVVTGGSQSNITDWDYQDVQYNHQGTQTYSNRVSGTSAGFDRAQAIKSDSAGNIYITGGLRDGSGFDIGTVKFNASGTYQWQNTYSNGPNSLGNDLIVDHDGNVYVCGESEQSGTDFFVEKIKSGGNDDWDVDLDAMGNNDTARAMCFDSYGNIIVTGQSFNGEYGNYDFLTIAFDSSGSELWRDLYNGPGNGDDNATNIVADANGNIFVTGQVTTDTGQATVTIKYRTDYFTQPPALDSPSVACLFYPNSGQLVDENDSDITDSVHYYTEHQYPRLYFGYGVMNMVWSHIDHDTTTTDTLQRVDVTFLNSTNQTEAYPVDEQDSIGFYNYFLTQCPKGITNVHGYGSLLYTSVYDGVNAIYSSDKSGLNLSFVCSPGIDLSEIGLAFTGHDSLFISQNWGLDVHSTLGDYVFEKPRVYQLDSANNRIALNWAPSWNIPSSGAANFTGWGSYDNAKPIVIEISSHKNAISNTASITWSTYIGGASDDVATSVCADGVGQASITGYTESSFFISQTGIIPFQFQPADSGLTDAFIAKFDTHGDLIWWTYYGGPDLDAGWDIAYDLDGSDGRLYVVGNTSSHDTALFVATSDSNCYQQKILQGVQGMIIELNATNGVPIWATSIGGEYTFLNACKVDQNHKLVIVGNDFSLHSYGTLTCRPQTSGSTAYFPLCDPGGGAYFQFEPSRFSGQANGDTVNNDNGIIVRFNHNGVLDYSTFYGGVWDDDLEDVDIDSQGNIFIVGGTFSDNLSSCTDTCTETASWYCEGFFPVCKNTGNVNTYYCNRKNVDEASINSTNSDGIIIKLDSSLNLKWSTFFGSQDRDFCSSVICNSNGDVYIAGYTNCRYPDTSCGVPVIPHSFPICHPNGYYSQVGYGGATLSDYDNFIARFSNDGVLKWSSFIGGYGSEGTNPKLAVDSRNNIILVGESNSPESSGHVSLNTIQYGSLYFQSHNADAYSGNYNGTDGYIMSFSEWNYPIWSTYIGGDGTDICYNVTTSPAGFLYVVGESAAPNFPMNVDITQGQCCHDTITGGKDAFLCQFDISGLINVPEYKNEIVKLNVYPSPTSDYLNVELSTDSKFPFNLEVFNLMGQLCFSQKETAVQGINKFRIPTSTLNNGLYFLEVSGQESKNCAKFIKNE